jgi:general secretion pathway protein I
MEVLVAVAIIGIAMPALLYSVAQRIDGTAYMRSRMIASWVASNQLSEAHLKTMNMNKSEVIIGSQGGSVEMAGDRWSWSMQTEPTGEEFQYHVQIKVWHELDTEEAALSAMDTYLYDFKAMREKSEYIR